MTWHEQIRDREAFTALYQVHHPAVFRFVCSITGDRWAAAEITQDVFVWLLHHLDRFDPLRGELTPFLLGVARKFLLRRGRTFRNLVPLDERLHSVVAAAEPESEIETESLQAAIAALPARYREIVVLCDLGGAHLRTGGRSAMTALCKW